MRYIVYDSEFDNHIVIWKQGGSLNIAISKSKRIGLCNQTLSNDKNALNHEHGCTPNISMQPKLGKGRWEHNSLAHGQADFAS